MGVPAATSEKQPFNFVRRPNTLSVLSRRIATTRSEIQLGDTPFVRPSVPPSVRHFGTALDNLNASNAIFRRREAHELGTIFLQLLRSTGGRRAIGAGSDG